MNHPVLSALAAMDAALDEITAVDPMYMSVAEKKAALTASARVRARAEALDLRLLSSAEDVAEQTGHRSAAHWVAETTHEAHGTLRRRAALAKALDRQWTQVSDGLSRGRVNLAQARVIDEALGALPTDLDPEVLTKAETHLVEQAVEHGPRELAVLGAKILSVVAPEIADEVEYQRLLAAEQQASAATRLTLRRRGDGSTDGHFRIPDLHAGMLRTYLHAFTAPRRRHLETPFGPLQPVEADEFANLPAHRQQGIALVALLERVLAKDLPQHGGTATSLVVTIDRDTLLADLHATGITPGIALTSAGDQITAGQARRLACQAGILPMVLDGKSEILDLGREARLFNSHQRKAMAVRDKTCTTIGCTIPAAFCQAHHPKPWSHGGKTNLKDGRLLCPWHHDRAHDPRWTTTYHPNGTTSFTRRQ